MRSLTEVYTPRFTVLWRILSIYFLCLNSWSWEGSITFGKQTAPTPLGCWRPYVGVAN